MEEERRCYDCGCVIEEDENYYELEDGDIICEDCRYDNYFECPDCHTLTHNDDGRYVRDLDGDVCVNCIDGYNYCPSCGEYYSDEVEFHENYHGEWVCESCYEEEYDDEYIIRDYHNRDLPIHFLTTSKDLDDETIFANKDVEKTEDNMLKLGMEIEVENTNGDLSSDEIAKQIRRELPQLELVFERDGSLRNDGFEIITQPMTMSFIRDHKEDFRRLCDILRENGCTSHNNGRCGQHIHFSRCYFSDDDDKYVGKLQLFFERYKNEILKFSRRTETSWCAWVSDHANYNREYYKSSKILCDYAKNHTGHGVAINLQHDNTIEIRVMRGTLKYETLMSNFEFVNSVVHVIKEKYTRQINFDKVVNYEGNEFLPTYCTQNAIYNSEYMNDETSNIFKILQTRKDNYENVKKDVRTNIQEVLGDMMSLTRKLMDDVPELNGETENTIKTLFNTTSSLQNLITNNIDFLNSSSLKEDNEKVEDNYSRYINNGCAYNYSNVVSYYENILDYLPTNDYTTELKEKMKNVLKTLRDKYANNGMGVEI